MGFQQPLPHPRGLWPSGPPSPVSLRRKHAARLERRPGPPRPAAGAVAPAAGSGQRCGCCFTLASPLHPPLPAAHQPRPAPLCHGAASRGSPQAPAAPPRPRTPITALYLTDRRPSQRSLSVPPSRVSTSQWSPCSPALPPSARLPANPRASLGGSGITVRPMGERGRLLRGPRVAGPGQMCGRCRRFGRPCR